MVERADRDFTDTAEEIGLIHRVALVAGYDAREIFANWRASEPYLLVGSMISVSSWPDAVANELQ
jgi:hypothetical protein